MCLSFQHTLVTVFLTFISRPLSEITLLLVERDLMLCRPLIGRNCLENNDNLMSKMEIEKKKGTEIFAYRLIVASFKSFQACIHTYMDTSFQVNT